MLGIDDKVRFLSDPRSYRSCSHVDALETHMSWIFLTADRAYKLKKPVSYPFLDFSSLEQRRFFCLEEVRLNRRLTRNVYLRAVPLSVDRSGRLTFETAGEVVDWVVEMMRLPETDMLDNRIRRSQITRSEIEQLGEMLATFYEGQAKLLPSEGMVYLDHFLNEQVINREVLLKDEFGLFELASPMLDRVDRSVRVVRAEIERRIADDRIVEGHGDLRPEHVCLADPPQIFDCIEFNSSMRIIDPFDEVNYLGLECALLGAGWIRTVLLDSVSRRLGDPPSRELMAVYSGFRSLLRARLCMAHLLEATVRHPEKWRPLAVSYLNAAEVYLREGPC